MKLKRRALLGLLVVGGAAAVAIGCCTPTLVSALIEPRGAFDERAVPSAPDYRNDAAWLALPTTHDEADVALPSLPAVDQSAAPVDVFYVHSTSSIAARWNAAVDDADVRAASIRGGTLIQGSVFNGCCAVYAPEYRQASGAAFVTPSPDADRAIEVAYGDVAAAFAEFSRRIGARPFILAGHSQGSVLLLRLLRERIPDRERLIAAYLIGAPVTKDALGGLRACATPTEVGCVVTFNARGPKHERNALDFGRDVAEEERLCVNPTLGAATSERVPRERHGGAVFFDSATPALLPAFASSACAGGRLVVDDRQPLPERDAMSGVLLWLMKENHHPIEYQLFYVDLRKDAQRRVGAALKP